jgi:hypothetical protein
MPPWRDSGDVMGPAGTPVCCACQRTTLYVKHTRSRSLIPNLAVYVMLNVDTYALDTSQDLYAHAAAGPE